MTVTRKPMLAKKAVLLANIESVQDTDSITSLSDADKRACAILVSNCEYSIDPTENVRDFVKADLSPMGKIVGRKLNSVNFQVELRGNGVEHNGSSAPRIGRLLRACSMEETAITTAALQGGSVIPGITNSSVEPTWASFAGTSTQTLLGAYRVNCTKAGATAVCRVRVTGGILGVDTLIGQSNSITAWVTNATTTPTSTVTVDETDPEQPTITVASATAGDKINMCIWGRDVDYTITATDVAAATDHLLAHNLAAAINAGTGDLAKGVVGCVDIQQGVITYKTDLDDGGAELGISDTLQDFDDWDVAEDETSTHAIIVYNSDGTISFGYLEAATGTSNVSCVVWDQADTSSGATGWVIDNSSSTPIAYEIVTVASLVDMNVVEQVELTGDSTNYPNSGCSYGTNTLVDTGQDFQDWDVASGNATHFVVIYNSDGTMCGAYVGYASSATTVTLHSALATGTSGNTNLGLVYGTLTGKYPVSYRIFPVATLAAAATSVKIIGKCQKTFICATDADIEGQVYTCSVLGQTFTYTGATSESQDDAATGLEALIDDIVGIGSSVSTNIISVPFYDSGNNYIGYGMHNRTKVTSGTTKILFGNSGLYSIPTFATGSMVLNDFYSAFISTYGYKYKPKSENQESVTLWFYIDGLLHKMTGSMGTFNLDAKAGGFGTINFSFTGSYNEPVSSEILSGVTYEMTVPPQIELAYFYLNFISKLKVETITFDMANTIAPRDDVNAEDGYAGVLITSREPSGSINPEMARPGEINLWSLLANSQYIPFQTRFGQTAGNTVWLVSTACQLSSPNYGERNNIRVFNTNVNFSRVAGDDEVFFYFL